MKIFVKIAMFLVLLAGPQTVHAQQPALAGALKFRLSTGGEMAASLQSGSGVPVYRMEKEYISGTRYRIHITNNGGQAYVYVIGSDLNNSVAKVFPHSERMSAALTRQNSEIALPSEQHTFEMDNTKGTDYALVLYSVRELAADDIVKKIRGAGGSFTQKVQAALGTDLIPYGDITLDRKAIKFSAASRKPVMAIIVEVDHISSGY